MPFSAIDVLPDPPQRDADPDTFADLADIFVVAMQTFSEQLNVFKTELETAAALIAAAPAYADPGLKALAGLTPAADKLAYFTGSTTSALATLTSVARTLIAQTTQANMRTTGLGMSANGSSLVSAADYTAMRVLLGLVLGTDVQVHDADLDAIAALTTTTFGRSLLTLADAAAGRTAFGAQAGLTFTSNANGWAVGFPIGASTYYFQMATVGSYTTAEGTQTLTWPVTFPTACLSALPGTKIASTGVSADMAYQLCGDPGASTVTVQMQRYGGGDWTNAVAPIVWGFGN